MRIPLRTLSGNGALLLMAAAVVSLQACGRRETPGEKPDAGAPPPAATAEAPAYDLAELLSRADPQQGRLLFMQCAACHALQPEAMPDIGPNLAGLFGRRAGSVPGFDYSPVMQVANFVWTPDQLDKWLRDPRTFLPDSRMVFLAIPAPQDRAHLIAYLQQETLMRPADQPSAVNAAAGPTE